jgi:hypothetical protein
VSNIAEEVRMFHFIREGGWPIFPVLILGALSLVSAVRYAANPRRELLALVIGFGVATVIMGAFGTALGVQMSARYIGEVDASRRWIFLLGLQESLNNLTVALAVAGLDALIATGGAWRMARRAPDAARALA